MNKIGYKGFNGDKVGIYCKPKLKKTYFNTKYIARVKPPLAACVNGFHFCEEARHVLTYYSFFRTNNVKFYAKVEGRGEIIAHNEKLISSELKVVKFLSLQEYIKILQSEGHGIKYITKRIVKDLNNACSYHKLQFNTHEVYKRYLILQYSVMRAEVAYYNYDRYTIPVVLDILEP